MNMLFISKGNIARCSLFIAFLATLIFLLSGVNRYFPLMDKRKSKEHLTKGNTKTQIVFLKTHKTGSSTVANILQRYGWKHKLNFALPRKQQGGDRYNYIGDFGATLHERDLAPLPEGETYDILFSHVIYNRFAFREVFRGRTFYFTILRNPWDQFVSAINYYGLADGYIQDFLTRQVAHPLSEYLASPETFEPSDVFLSFTNNRQLFDLGFPFDHRSPRNSSHVMEYIDVLTSDLDFVMITEFFDESLILLKRHLNLTMAEIVYIPQNTRRMNKTFNLSNNDKDSFNRWSKGDIILYQTFRESLLKTMQQQKDLNAEVQYFKLLTNKVRTYCLGDQRMRNLTIEKSHWSDELLFTYDDCYLIMMDELSFLEKLQGNL